ncbi:dihydrofolate reductase family protein [Geodermatophilus sp. SYSU D00700]
MATVISHMSMSLDGFVAGPDQSEEHPLGIGGLALHQWHIGRLHPADVPWQERLLDRGDAYVMGRNMFGPVRGPWQGDWRGWWGSEPPYHAPVFVLTHHEREPLEMAGGTTFFFVTGGFDAALRQASDAAGDGVVDVAGGASTVRQALASGALDELVVDLVPAVLGRGEPIFTDLTGVDLTPVEVDSSPLATHIRYRVERPAHRRTA